jgi:GrpB-like predicted nucleotidyltransferase (UPF0157 family)
VTIVLVAHDPAWAHQFVVASSQVRVATGSWATRIDHIGSTSVPDLVAKPVIDVQVSTGDPSQLDDPAHPVRHRLLSVGYELVLDNDDRRKRFLRRRANGPDINLHVRRDGCVSQQQALLFRDYLRADESARRRYGDQKSRLARRRWPSVDHYADAKSDIVWALLREADRWSWSGWRPGASDA